MTAVLAKGAAAAHTEERVAPPETSKPRRSWTPLLRLISPLALLVLWQVVSSAGLVSDKTLASPAQVISAAAELWSDGSLQDALAVSVQRVLLGVVLGVAVAVLLGVLAGFSRIVELAIDPPIQMLRTVPFLGLIPLFIIWFGIGEEPKVFLVALGVMFPLYLNLFAGIRSIDGKLIEVAETLGLSKFQLATHVILPGALPQALTGLRLSLGVAWLALIVAEQINADAGLGYLVNNARIYFRIDIVIFGLLVYAFLGLATDALVRALEGRLLTWRKTYQGA
ncbi:ABC transporter permease [Prescottella agglutinans]|uniref:Sulfonate transport system permease protein n=1 Tax=Prescottella agglutinans TaxID=1644129 RepID=A0ABT6MFN7_9NOCA|nr:ABC transporter permease [Prescottella agglutinans]MDH6283103.1 sulfonate transport system permease protein [Prescottella agglutinans]